MKLSKAACTSSTPIAGDFWEEKATRKFENEQFCREVRMCDGRLVWHRISTRIFTRICNRSLVQTNYIRLHSFLAWVWYTNQCMAHTVWAISSTQLRVYYASAQYLSSGVIEMIFAFGEVTAVLRRKDAR